jgi:ethanolamine utilization protein EutQ (cupin superfamily)
VSVIVGRPVSRKAADVPSHELAEGGAVKRLIAARDGSSVLIGLFELAPGQVARFTLTGGSQEIYYLIAGSIRIQWSDGQVVAKHGEAILFPPDETYVVSALGTTPVELVYTVWPAPKEAE